MKKTFFKHFLKKTKNQIQNNFLKAHVTIQLRDIMICEDVGSRNRKTRRNFSHDALVIAQYFRIQSKTVTFIQNQLHLLMAESPVLLPFPAATLFHELTFKQLHGAFSHFHTVTPPDCFANMDIM